MDGNVTTPTSKPASACVNAENPVFHQGIVFVVRQEHTDAAYAVALLRPRRERPRHRAAEPSDEFAPSKANAHLALPWPRRLGKPM
jgi:hypothetical protein